MGADGQVAGPVPDVGGFLGRDVLHKGAAHCHVDQLHPAADAEDGDAPLQGLMEEGQFEVVPPVIDIAQLGMRLVAVV